MPDYTRSKIYQLKCLNTGKVYVGHTTQKYLSTRLSGHITKFNLWKKGEHHYVSSFPIIEGGRYEISLVEAYSCNNVHELRMRERFYINKMDCINHNIPSRTHNEYNLTYHRDHRQSCCEKMKVRYRERYREKMLEKYTCGCGSVSEEREINT